MAITNSVPEAEAGPDHVVDDTDGDGIEAVILDGSTSTDPDGDVLAYQWLDETGAPLATEAAPELVLPVGSHTLTLEVTDAAGATASDGVIVEVRAAPVVAAAAATLLDTAGAPVGTATFVTEADGSVTVMMVAYGLPPGVHGVHLHETGACDPWTGEPFVSAGGHVNPTQAPHGAHAGDLGNLTADAFGVGQIGFTTTQFTLAQLLDADGSALILHADADDGVSEPEGNSGMRVACGALAEVGLDAVDALNAEAQVAAAAAAEAVAAEQAAEQAAPDESTATDPGTDPAATDSDGDALTDAEEVDIYGTDPLVPDTDSDGVGDGAEVAAGTDPLIPDVVDAEPGVDVGDPAGEVPNPAPETDTNLDANPVVVDSEGDGLSDTDEATYGTDPANPDSDGDGLGDADEVLVYGTNPLDPMSVP